MKNNFFFQLYMTNENNRSKFKKITFSTLNVIYLQIFISCAKSESDKKSSKYYWWS